MHQVKQQKLREEIEEILEKHGSLTYKAVQEMEYLHMIVSSMSDDNIMVSNGLPFVFSRNHA